MKKDKFFIKVRAHGSDVFKKVEGYVKKEGGYWFGIHKWEGNLNWTVTLLLTGLKVRDYPTIKKCEQALPECASIVKSALTGKFHNLYEKDIEQCMRAYDDSPDTAAMYWKIFGEDN